MARLVRPPSLASISAPSRPTSAPSRLPRCRPRPRHNHRGRQGQRVRARRGRSRSRARAGRRRDARVRRHRGRRRPARAGVRVPILVFGALSVSDLDGVFEHDLTPDDLHAVGARARSQAAAADTGRRCGCHLKIDTGMNRLGFRHDNLRAHAAGGCRQPALRLDAVYTHFATADDPEPRCSTSSASASRPRCARASVARHRRRASGTRRTARRSCATSASGTTSSGRGCCSTASSRRRWPRRCRLDLPCHSTAVSWR